MKFNINHFISIIVVHLIVHSHFIVVHGQEQDSKDQQVLDSIVVVNSSENNLLTNVNYKIHLESQEANSFTTLQQRLKGNVGGLLVLESNGEPGTHQGMILRGLKGPVGHIPELQFQQPTVYVDGIPLITDHTFTYHAQDQTIVGRGPLTNVFAGIPLNNIESIEVVKDPIELAYLGPMASNGAIRITSKKFTGGYRNISIHSYFGMTGVPKVSTTNAQNEIGFRNKFYQKYKSYGYTQSYPDYLQDQANPSYFSNSSWANQYYESAFIQHLDIDIAGGNPLASFRFNAGTTTDNASADNVGLQKSNVSFFVNMKPFDRVSVSSMVSGARIDRRRNKNLRDQYLETGYIPNISSPIAPNGSSYSAYMDEHKKSIDDNFNNIVRGYISADFDYKYFHLNSMLGYDYNESIRDIFWPSTILETVNYASNYFGYNQRAIWGNSFTYRQYFRLDHLIKLELGASILDDLHRYNYSKGYNGLNDFVKSTSGGDYEMHRITDQEKMRLISGIASFSYQYKTTLKFQAMLRVDGSSNVQPDNKWLNTPAFSASWDIWDQLLSGSTGVSALSTTLSFARTGKINPVNRYAEGPQYTVGLGWSGAKEIPSYNGFAGLSRPYGTGWVGYGIDWPYSDQLNLNLSGGFLNDRISYSLNVYKVDDQNQIVSVPVPSEYGYEFEIVNGMNVRNQGIDLSIQSDILKNARELSWASSFNISFNKNEVTKLPDQRSNMIIGDRMYMVGKPVDQFWLFENEGIYQDDSELTTSPKIHGMQASIGDPIWRDINSDNAIDERDKTLKGNFTPQVFGGWINSLAYKQFDLKLHVFFGLGHEVLNARASNIMNFVRNDTDQSPETIREIFFWQNENVNHYPVYNAWSDVNPYRMDQDLFLENASYIKVRTLSVGYHFLLGMGNSFPHKKGYVYLTANNLWTGTSFSGLDPELSDFDGVYRGYAIPIPRTYVLGINLNL